ncbi:MAG: hypothetical protein KDA37_07235, partial [Planctomycetales bacterium]|nr:hypothetical protein [Planctomycetales bacterium]
MTRSAFALLLSLIPLGQCAAQRTQGLPTLTETFAADATLRAVSFVDARHGWAVGDRGVILATRDGGRRWDPQPTPVDCPLTGVWFVDSQRGWAVGGSVTPYTHTTHGVVLQTQDGGFSWRLVPATELPLLRGVRMFDNTTGLAWGEPSPVAPSGLFRTNNGGRNWLPAGSTESHAWLAGAFAARERGVLVDSRSAPCAASERGVEDHQLAPRTAPPLYAATLATNGVGWLAGAGGELLTTDDGARTWHAPPGAPHDGALAWCDWRAVAARGKKVWLAGSPGALV